MKLLIAEDEMVSRWVLKETLTAWGHDVTACENGKDAWELYRKGDYRLVISDWMMPYMNGLEFCRKIRTATQGVYCYFILLTTESGKDSFLEGMEAGADDYLIKPFDKDHLRARLMVAERFLNFQLRANGSRANLPVCSWCDMLRESYDLSVTMEERLAEKEDVANDNLLSKSKGG